MRRYGCMVHRLDFKTARGFDVHLRTEHGDEAAHYEGRIARWKRHILRTSDEKGIVMPAPRAHLSREELLLTVWLEKQGYSVMWPDGMPLVREKDDSRKEAGVNDLVYADKGRFDYEPEIVFEGETLTVTLVVQGPGTVDISLGLRPTVRGKTPILHRTDTRETKESI